MPDSIKEEIKEFDCLSAEDLLNKTNKSLLVAVYIKVKETNGQVQRNKACIEVLEKTKISITPFAVTSSLLGLLIILFTVLRFLGNL